MESVSSVAAATGHLSWFEKTWQGFCRLMVKIFYRRFEVTGLDHLPESQGVILCANHVNALADVVVIQAATRQTIRPLARSGLFDNPLLKPVLRLIGAVPIYRRNDPGVDVRNNRETFKRCYQLLAEGETLIIFPEGQSHDVPQLMALKTGAARLAFETIQATGKEPAVIPVGLTFPEKGQFRSAVLVQFGKPIDLPSSEGKSAEERVVELTERIRGGLEDLTLNADSWEEVSLITRVEHFFALRHGKYRQRNLQQRLRAQQRLIDGQRLLRKYEPDRVRALISQLKQFEKICRYCGVKDYQLEFEYKPALIGLYLLRMTWMVLVVFPVAMWGILNGYVPYQLTKRLSPLLARGANQTDTTKMALGLFFFSVFWAFQSYLVLHYFGIMWMAVYILTLIISTTVALLVRGEMKKIRENIRVFMLFLFRRDLKTYLRQKRQALEKELAKLVRIANRLSHR